MLHQYTKSKSPIIKSNLQSRTGLARLFILAAAATVLSVTSSAHAAAAPPCAAPNPTGPYGTVTATKSVPAGTYRVWSRLQASDAANTAYTLVVQDPCTFNKSVSTTTVASWTWVSSGTVTVTGGNTAIGMYGTQPGVKLDRVLLLADQACIPAGTGDNCASAVTPPAVTLTAPPAGASLSGTATLSATATSAAGIAKVDFLVDGQVVGSDSSAAYSYAWNTAAAANGNHTLTATATDTAGNTGTSSPVSVSVSNGGGLPGDINGDGRVNAIDLSALISHDGLNYPPADFNRDGTVGAADMAILLAKWTW